MKPTVIPGGNGANNPATTTNSQPAQQTGSNAPAQEGGNTRDFPHFQSGFGFRPHFDDMFDDDDFGPHLRARMMRDPFAAFGGRFHDPEWETMRGGRRRAAPQAASSGSNARGNIFDHIPAEFRNYLPENFGFHQPASQEYSQSYPPKQQHYEGQPQQQPQQYEAYAEQPHQQHYYQQQQAPRPKYCDASIQTDHDTNPQADSVYPNQNLNQHNLRNTMDMGQKSPQEATSQIGPDGQATYYASTGTDPQTPQQYAAQNQPEFNQDRQHPRFPPPPPQRHYVPPQNENAQTYQHYPQQQAPPRGPQQANRGPPSQPNDSNFVRHVPIFIEGRSDHVSPPQQTPQQQKQQQQYYQQPKPPQQQPHAHQEPHARPTPLNTQQAQAQAQMYAQGNNQTAPPGAQGQVPQTPQTTECINKIQNIQRDVLNLMTQVEQFAGRKQDKEYLYLDEMLTSNLLKLDTIDTDGKDSIRLARREAIKCIQASINVLEAKAEENAKTAQASVMEIQNPEGSENEANVIALPCGDAQSAETGTSAETQQSEQLQAADASKSASTQQVPKEVSEVVEPERIDSNKNFETPVENSQEDTSVPETKTSSSTSNVTKTDQTLPESTDTSDEPKQPDTSATPNSDPSKEEASSLEAPTEQIEKSSSQKENKPPGSPKKKIVKKMKKPPGDRESTTDEVTKVPQNENEADMSDQK